MKPLTVPSHIMKKAMDSIDEVSDDIGEEQLDDDHILKFEGWSGFCVSKVWEETKEDKEEACEEFAEKESYKIIENEWKPQMDRRGYKFIDGGYARGGLYGRTWAIFKRR